MSFFKKLFNDPVRTLLNEDEEKQQEEEFILGEEDECENPEKVIKCEEEENEEEYEIVEREILPAKIICPDCGGITLEGLDFCDKCGGELH